ncbi:MAG: VWA domain-containing protein [Nitrospira sp.]|nr:VWA domain-containing protein [Nitrospira sp.]
MATLSDIELAKIPDTRQACVLLLDTSGSMAGSRIDELNVGLAVFKDEVLKDEQVSRAVDLAVITFDADVKTVYEFGSVESFEPPKLTAQYQTFMGEGILTALAKLEERKRDYKSHGTPYYKPWLFLITDGLPEGESPERIEEAKFRLQTMIKGNHVQVFAIGVGDVDLTQLEAIAQSKPLRLKGTKFRELFEWMVNSAQQVTRSKPGDMVKLIPPNWAELSS